jgi:hypothetical protein
MDKLARAYEIGALQALFDAGLIKESAPRALMGMLETGAMARQSLGKSPKYMQRLEDLAKQKVQTMPQAQQAALATAPKPQDAHETAVRMRKLLFKP